MVALGAWVAIQAAGLAFARGVGGAAAGFTLHGHSQPRRHRKCHGPHRAVRPAARVSPGLAVRDCRADRVVGMRNRGIGRSGAIALEGAAERRAWMTTYEQTLRSFLKDDDIAALA